MLLDPPFEFEQELLAESTVRGRRGRRPALGLPRCLESAEPPGAHVDLVAPKSNA
jgi:hypothetical protein